MDDCLFCRIVRGEIPAKVIYSDEHVIAFDDITPQAPVHTLVIPRTHYENLNDDIPDDDLAAVFSAIKRVAEIKGVAESGYRTIINSGPDANQTVMHLHAHVVGGQSLAHGMVTFAER